MFEKGVYIKRREQLKQMVGSGLILLLANEQSSMSYRDNWYPFRQDSSFLYFSGLDLPSLAIIINVDDNTETLFGNDLTVDEIVWNGPQPSIRELADNCGIKTVQRLNELEATLKQAQRSKQNIHYLPPYRAEHSEKINSLLGIELKQVAEKASVPLIKAIVALRSIKSEVEVAEIQKAVNTTAEMHLLAMHTAKTGMTEANAAGLVQGVSISAGGNLAFPTILTTKGEILHNHYSNALIPQGRLILLDAGAENSMHYTGDLTRTFPADAKFSPVQKDVYNIVLEANLAAVAAMKPGVLFKDVHFVACEKLVEGLQQLGLMQGDVKEAVAAGAHTLFFQCGLGHMMGMDVHDMENLGEQYVGYTDDLKKSTEFGLKSLRLGKALEAGFIVTVEPGLYFIPHLMDIWAADKKHSQFIKYDKLDAFRDFGGVRIEDDFLITEAGSKLLSTTLPRTVEDIEAIRMGLDF